MSGFQDRSELLESFRAQRDRLRRHLLQVEQQDRRLRVDDTVTAFVSNDAPFFEHAGLGVPHEAPSSTSRPWTTDGRPVSGNVAMPAIMENFDDPYDPVLAAEAHASGIFDHTCANLNHDDATSETKLNSEPERQRLAHGARMALASMNRIIEQFNLDDSREDAAAILKEREEIQAQVRRQLLSLERVQAHVEKYLTQHEVVDRDLEALIQLRSTEIDALGDNIKELGERRGEELLLHEWSERLKRREAANRHLVLRIRGEVKDASTVTIPAFEFSALPHSNLHAEVTRTASESTLAARGGAADAIGSSSARGEAKKGEKGLRAARAIGALNARRSKPDRTVLPEDERFHAKPHIDRPVLTCVDEDLRRATDFPDVAPPMARVVLVCMTLKHMEISDALEKDTANFMAATYTLMKAIAQCCADLNGYAVRVSRYSYTIAFGSDADAITFAMQVQQTLVDRVRWPSTFDHFRGTTTVRDPKMEDRVLLQGLRLAVGLHVAEIDAKTPWRLRADGDPVTGRVDFVGPDAAVASQLADVARGGEIFLTAAAWKSMKQNAAVAVFASASTRELTLRFLHEEARRSSLFCQPGVVTVEGFVLVPCVALHPVELQNRKIVFGVHPREHVPAMEDELRERIGAISGSSRNASPPAADRRSSLLVPLSTSMLEPSYSSNASPLGVGAIPDEQSNTLFTPCQPLRPAGDLTPATFCVLLIPDFAKLVDAAGSMWIDALRSVASRAMEVVCSTRSFYNRTSGGAKLATEPSLKVGGFVDGDAASMVAMFKSDSLACQWALLVHEELKLCDWPSTVVDYYRAAHEEPSDSPIWRGPRVAIGLASSVPTAVCDVVTGVWKYEGQGKRVAHELCAAAKPGQTLVTSRIVESLRVKGIPGMEFMAELITPKAVQDTQVFALYSRAFEGRHRDVGRHKPERLARLLRALHGLKDDFVMSSSSNAASNSVDVFLAVAERMCTTSAQFDGAVRAAHGGIVSQQAAELFVTLIRVAERQALVDHALLEGLDNAENDSSSAGVSMRAYRPDSFKDGERVRTHAGRLREENASAEPVTSATDVGTQCSALHVEGSPCQDSPLQEEHSRPSHLPSGTSVTSRARAGKPRRVQVPQTQLTSFGDANSAPASSGDDSPSVDEDGDKVYDTARRTRHHHSSSKIRNPKSRHGKQSESIRLYKTQAELLQEKEDKWKALHRAIQRRKGLATDDTDAVEASATAEAAVARRRELQIQAIHERKQREEDRLERKKQRWRARQEERKLALRDIIRARLEEMMMQATKEREAQTPWRSTIKPTPPPASPPVHQAMPSPTASPRRSQLVPAAVPSTTWRSAGSTTDEHVVPSTPDVTAAAGLAVPTPPSRSLGIGAGDVVSFYGQTAAEIAAIAVHDLELSSLDSSVLDLLDDDSDDNGDEKTHDDGDTQVDSDVNKLLEAAGLACEVDPGAPDPSSRITRHVARKVRRLAVADKLNEKEKKLIPTQTRAVQCDIGPRVVTRVAKAERHEPRGLRPIVFGGVGEASGSARAEETRAYDAAEVLPVAAPRSLPKSKVLKNKAVGAREAAHADVQQLSVQSAGRGELTGDVPQLEMGQETRRTHDDGVEEEMSFAEHLAQRRDVIASFAHVVDDLREEVIACRAEERWASVPALERRAAHSVFAPLRHYLEQMLAHSPSDSFGAHDRDKAASMLADVVAFQSSADVRRRADARLRWKIALQRFICERRAHQAVSLPLGALRNAQLALVTSHLKRLQVWKAMQRSERGGRAAHLEIALHSLFAGRIDRVPEPSAAGATLIEYCPPATTVAHQASAPAKFTSGPLTAFPRKGATAAALKAAGLGQDRSRPRETYAGLRETLLSYDGTLSEMPAALDYADGIHATVLPVPSEADKEPGKLAQVPTQHAPTELMRIELMLQESSTRRAAVAIDRQMPPVRAQLPQLHAALPTTAVHSHVEWLDALNLRIAEHQNRVLGPARSGSSDDQPRCRNAVDPRTQRSPLPPVHKAKHQAGSYTARLHR